ncbi:MAG: FliO/MopB family protein [Porticoccaceae bacterium]
MAAEYGWAEWLSMIASFLLVIGLLVATLFALKKLNLGIGGDEGKRLKILEVKNLGARQKLLLVSVNTEQILLGLTPQGITRLGGWEAHEALADDKLATNAPTEQKDKNFKQLLSQTVKRQKD